MEAEVCRILRNFGYKEEDEDLSKENFAKTNPSRDRRYSENKLLKMKKDELKFAAQDRCLSLKGTKIDLVKRIINDIQNTPTNVLKVNTGVNNEMDDTNDKIQARNITKGATKMCNGDSSASDMEEEVKGNFEKPNLDNENFTPGSGEDIEIEDWSESCLKSLWLHPFKTLHYAIKEVGLTLIEFKKNPQLHRKQMLLFAVILILVALSIEKIDLLIENRFNNGSNKYLFCIPWWIGLGIISSVGVGSGLHTFMMYLIPYVALVTLAEYEILGSDAFSSLNKSNNSSEDLEKSSYNVLNYNHNGSANHFYASNIPQMISISTNVMFKILNKVKLEVVCFGLGTVLGELPSYFEAKDAEKLDETQEDVEDENDNFHRTNPPMKSFLDNFGFPIIILSASIPHPLFDVVASTCGYFAISFAKFFTATLIGKLIKVNAQLLLWIWTLNTLWTANTMAIIPRILWIDQKLETNLKDYLTKQFASVVQCHKDGAQYQGILTWCFHQNVLMAMILFYVLSVFNAFAHYFHKRQLKKRT